MIPTLPSLLAEEIITTWVLRQSRAWWVHRDSSEQLWGFSRLWGRGARPAYFKHSQAQSIEESILSSDGYSKVPEMNGLELVVNFIEGLENVNRRPRCEQALVLVLILVLFWATDRWLLVCPNMPKGEWEVSGSPLSTFLVGSSSLMFVGFLVCLFFRTLYLFFFLKVLRFSYCTFTLMGSPSMDEGRGVFQYPTFSYPTYPYCTDNMSVYLEDPAFA